MKKFFYIVFFSILLSVSFARDFSNFEKIQKRTGTVTKVENVFAGSFNFDGKYGKLDAEIAVITDLSDGQTLKALKFTNEYHTLQSESGIAEAYLDEDEIGTVLQAFNLIQETFLQYDKTSPYEEITYTANSGLKIGAYHALDTYESNIYIKLNDYSTVSCSIYRVESFIEFLNSISSVFNLKNDEPLAVSAEEIPSVDLTSIEIQEVQQTSTDTVSEQEENTVPEKETFHSEPIDKSAFNKSFEERLNKMKSLESTEKVSAPRHNQDITIDED